MWNVLAVLPIVVAGVLLAEWTQHLIDRRWPDQPHSSDKGR